MADYNIIYTSSKGKPYLWNGSSFDLIKKSENEKLLFSGASYTEKDLNEALEKSRDAAKKLFPGDERPEIKPVEVPVNSKSDAPGHSPHIIS
ncbi:MAG: hypothetical protein JST19_11230 [Bacteroidetes bacterium]|nr:hypothetical protein [Bacteroidota bacterium]